MSEQGAAGKRPRIEIIDAVRGISILLMVVYHFHFDMYEQGFISGSVMFHPVFNILQQVFASLFIIMSGISCRFSHSNLKRGLLMFAAGMAITLVTYIYNPALTVRFGILHFLGAAACIYALVGKRIDKLLPRRVAPFVWAALAAATWTIQNHPINCKWLWVFGFTYDGFSSSDYFPLFPYLFVYLLGAWAGQYVVEGRMPKWFYSFHCKPLSFIGRNTIWVYLLHQPLCMGIILLMQKLS